MHEVREVLRLWARGESLRSIVRLAMVDRKTVRRYTTAAADLGVAQNGDESQLTDGGDPPTRRLARMHFDDRNEMRTSARSARVGVERGDTFSAIAGRLGRDVSTVSREVNVTCF